MKTKQIYLVLFFLLGFTQMVFSQSEKNLAGDWQGPNNVTLRLEYPSMKGKAIFNDLYCERMILKWSATESKIYIKWDMTPYECLNIYTKEKQIIKPKTEIDDKPYSISKEEMYGMKLEKLEIAGAIYTRAIAE